MAETPGTGFTQASMFQAGPFAGTFVSPLVWMDEARGGIMLFGMEREKQGDQRGLHQIRRV